MTVPFRLEQLEATIEGHLASHDPAVPIGAFQNLRHRPELRSSFYPHEFRPDCKEVHDAQDVLAQGNAGGQHRLVGDLHPVMIVERCLKNYGVGVAEHRRSRWQLHVGYLLAVWKEWRSGAEVRP